MYKIGIDIGGTKINIGLFDSDTKKLMLNSKAYISDIISLPGYIRNTVDDLCGKCGIDFNLISSCGIGIPGTVSADGREILKAPNISILSESIADETENALGIPAGVIQDSRAAAWGEYLCGAGREYNTVVCITLGTGIGTGIVMDGRIYAGALGCAGELGHLPVVENGRACGCGRKGCLEKYCAGGGLDITAAEILGRGKTASDLFAEISKGNIDAKSAVEKAISALGAGLVSIVNLLSPDCILFSGGLSAQEDLYLNPVIEYIRTHCYVADRLPHISKAALGENSPLYGAAFMPMLS